MLGHDFLPFYTAGTMVREGRPHDLYDLAAIKAAEYETARQSHLDLGDALGPFWNPPFYALPFAPLSALPYRHALAVWWSINLAALAGAIVLLCRMLPTPPARSDWRTWGLVSLLILVSAPFLQALTHGQNTFISLL